MLVVGSILSRLESQPNFAFCGQGMGMEDLEEDREEDLELDFHVDETDMPGAFERYVLSSQLNDVELIHP